jgi:hypothetical protein
MTYGLGFKPRASRDLNDLDRVTFERVMSKINALREDLAGDV